MNTDRSMMRALRRYLDEYQWTLKRYPKAAKKARNRKKWMRRYGPGITEQFEYIEKGGKTFIDLLRGPAADSRNGGNYWIPIPLEIE